MDIIPPTVESILIKNKNAIINNECNVGNLYNEMVHAINFNKNANSLINEQTLEKIFKQFYFIDLKENLGVQLKDIIYQIKKLNPAIRNVDLIYIYDLLVHNIYQDFINYIIPWDDIFNSDLTLFQQGHFWGLKDINNKTVLPARYEYISDFFNGFATIIFRGKSGVVDNTGKVIIEAVYDNKNFVFINDCSKYLIKDVDKKTSGIINTKGEKLLETEFYLIDVFDDCFTTGRKNLYGILNINLRKIIEPKFIKIERIRKNIICCYNNRSEFSIYSSDLKCVAINLEKCELFESDYFIIVNSDKKSGLLDRQGKILFEPKFDSIKKISLSESNFYVLVDTVGESTIYDLKENKIVITCNKISIINYNSDCLLVENNNKAGLYSIIKGFIIPTEYDLIKKGIIEKHYIVKKEAKYGIVNVNNEIIIALNYDEICILDNLYIVKQKNLYGICSREGKIKLNIKYNEIKLASIYYKTFIVNLEKLFGVIDEEENEIIPCMYEEIIQNENIFALKYQNKYGILSNKGDIITDLIYDRIELYYKQFILIKGNIVSILKINSKTPIVCGDKTIEEVKIEIKKENEPEQKSYYQNQSAPVPLLFKIEYKKP